MELGFAVQFLRAERRGISVVPIFARRLVVGLVLGLVHLFLLFQGDIVSTYACWASRCCCSTSARTAPS
jgi:uncharacterized protein